MKVGFIGAGSVGTALGCFFSKHGIELSGFFSKSHGSAMAAASRSGSNAFENIKDIVLGSDVIMVTAPDNAISDVCGQLDELDVNWGTRTVCNTSGVHSSKIFSRLYEKGASAGSLHPMLSFADFEASVKTLASAHFTIEGSGKGMDDIRMILARCGVNYTEINADVKPIYHAAACMISNYMVTLVDTGLKMLEASGFEQESAYKLADQLIKSTVQNIALLGTERALTGPISRGDAETAGIHLSKLEQVDSGWYELYRLLGLMTAGLAHRGGKITRDKYDELKEVFKYYEQ